ncbi:unnamed protein product [Onchocerca flexuosa]|uniref:Sodium:neurotransmitter symporter family protein n=1 Tax=Onchocerca flexuosa TaxID=387005 RepID=A0A183H1C6_9BILA|nr:unnamed protein product [Onchocerca flexuosa]
MHLCLGQYSGLTASGAFRKLMPIASGIGWTLVLLALPVSIYYNIIVAWSIYYFWFSLKGFFVGDLPWSQCNPEWPENTPCCLLNGPAECFLQPHAISSPEAYFHYEVLNRVAIHPHSQFTITNATMVLLNATFSGIDLSVANENIVDSALGPIQSHLVISLAFAWILVFLGVFNGIGSIGWAVSITSTLPYLLLGILLLCGMSLPGAAQGLMFLFKPEIGKIWSIPMWKAAAEQVFYSLGIDAGPLISMASFSRYRNNIYRDAVAVVLINAFTSIFAGMVIFSFTGFIAQSQQRPIDDILQRDPLYIAFTIYPGATTFMDMMGPLCAILFFAMLILFSIDAQFAWIEMIVSSIINKFNTADKRTETRLMGGIFLFNSIENMNANWNSFSLSLLQITLICYIYGVNNFITDAGEMLRVSTSLKEILKSENLSIQQVNLWRKLKFFFGPTGGYIRWTWSLCSPCILLFLLITSIFNYQRVAFEDYPLPLRYELIAWFTMVGPLIVIPCTAFRTLYEMWRNRMPLLSAFDCSQWRHKNVEGGELGPKHIADESHDYWSIADPVSRVASSRRPNASLMDEVGYETMVEMINEWAKKNAATLCDRFVDENDAESQQNNKQLNKKFLSRKSLIQQNSTELTLFGAPPTVEISEKTNTVIYRPKKGDQVRKPLLEDNSLKSTKCNSPSPLLSQTRRVSWTGSVKKDNGRPTQLLRRSSSVEKLALDYRLAHFEHMLQHCDSTDHHSFSSISITPIDLDFARNCSSSTISYLDDTSETSSKRNLPILKRPEPINAPTPFTQL